MKNIFWKKGIIFSIIFCIISISFTGCCVANKNSNKQIPISFIDPVKQNKTELLEDFDNIINNMDLSLNKSTVRYTDLFHNHQYNHDDNFKNFPISLFNNYRYIELNKYDKHLTSLPDINKENYNPSTQKTTKSQYYKQDYTDGQTLFVGGNGLNNYTKIQDAIDDSTHGDTVYVFNESSPYYENLVIKKSIYLIGEDKNSTIIDGKGNGHVISIQQDFVQIFGFTIQNSGNIFFNSGILIESNNNIINNNIIRNNAMGFRINVSSNNKILNNIISNNRERDIYFYYSYMNNISNNYFIDEYIAPIDLFHSNNNNISNNYFLNSINSLIVVQYSVGNIISNNSDLYAIYIAYSFTNIFNNNLLSGGIFNWWSYLNIVENNLVNGDPILYLENKSDFIIEDDVGQVILISCENITITKQNFTSWASVQLQESNDCIIIENAFFGGQMLHQAGIYLIDSNYNLIKENNFIDCGTGIHVLLSIYNQILYNNFLQNIYGIWLESSHYNIVNNNTLSQNSQKAIYLDDCGHNYIEENHIQDNYIGLYIYISSFNIISKNIFQSDGVFIDFTTSSTYDSTKNYFLNNTINEKPIEYLEEVSDVTISNKKGQIILVNCSNITITDQDLFSVSVGVIIDSSQFCKIFNNKIYENILGISLYGVNNNNMIYNNNIYNNSEGIYLFSGENNQISDGEIFNNKYGIIIEDTSRKNNVSFNNVKNNEVGIFLRGSSNNIIKNNNCSNNSIDGILLSSISSHNIIENNSCMKNMKGISLKGPHSHFYVMEQNRLINNTCNINQQGILLNNAEHIIIINNTCKKNKIGIYLYKSFNNSIVNNTCCLSSFEGIAIYQSSNNFLSLNIIDNNWLGLVIAESNLNEIVYNYIMNNEAIGIALQKTQSNIINDNNIYSNSYYGLAGISVNVDAQNNWWGAWRPSFIFKISPFSGDTIIFYRGRVKLIPWLRKPAVIP
jgi:parallel beta-helix repeat protein